MSNTDITFICESKLIHITKSNKCESIYSLDFEDCYTFVFCPVCDNYITCDFTDHVPDWFIKQFNIKEGDKFYVEEDEYEYPESGLCTLGYKHKFMLKSLTDVETCNEPYTIEYISHLIIPHSSEITKLIIEQAMLILWYETELSDIFDMDVTLPDIKFYLYSIVSWDVPFKCEFFDRFSKKTCCDVSFKIVSFINWFDDILV